MQKLKKPLPAEGIIKCEQCEQLNIAIRIMRILTWRGTKNALSGLCFDQENKEILVKEEALMRAIQLANPAQPHRKIRIVRADNGATQEGA